MPIQIPLDGGLITQADAEEVGINGCTLLQNVEFDKPGLIYKRLGRGAPVTVSSTNIQHITRWVDPDDTPYWVLTTTIGDLYVTEDLTSLGSVVFNPNPNAIVRIYNYGSMLRFAAGIGNPSQLYQKIDRDFFWDGYATSPAFGIDIARPIEIPYEVISAGQNAGLGEAITSGMSHDTTTYEYKMTFVYDGNQETPLSDNLVAVSNNSIGGVVAIDGDDDCFYADIKFLEADWNNRCTGINIYRSTDAGPYRKIISASTLNKDRDANIITVSDAVVGNYFGTTSGGLTSVINGKEIIFNTDKAVESVTINTVIVPGYASLTDTISNADLLNTYGVYSGGTDLIFSNIDGEEVDDTNTIGSWWVGDDITHASNGVKMLEGDTAGWVSTFGGPSTTTEQVYMGTNSLKCSAVPIPSVSGNNIYYLLPTTGFTDNLVSTDYVTVGFWWKLLEFSPNQPDATVKVSLRLSSGTSPFVVDYDAGGANGVAIGTGDKWRFAQKTYLLSDIGGYSDGYNFHFWVALAGADPYQATKPKIYIDNLVIGQSYYNSSTGKMCTGANVVFSPTIDLGAEDSKKGWATQVSAITGEPQHAVNSSRSFFKNYTAPSVGTDLLAILNNQYAWRDLTTYHNFRFNDKGETDGIVHPTGETSIDVNFTYSVNLEGRQYVADVALNPDDENELHNDWVLFSELNQPDVIPISNYISIPDMQGGQITGLGKLIGDLVVFQSKGIYRISIPSADPMAWSLSESEPNIGCIATDSIVEHEAGIFFAGTDHMYHLGSNFQAIPITQSIKDDYQGTTNLENTRCIVDVKKNRLLCKFGDTNTIIYCLDLSKFRQGQEHWSQISTPTVNSKTDLFVINEDLKVFTIDADTHSYVLELDPSSPTEALTTARQTGWISIGDLNRNGVLRRLNLRYNSGDALTVTIYTDGDASTVDKTITVPANPSGDDWYKCKPNVRCRYFMVKIVTASSTNAVEIRRLEVEFE